MAEQIIVFEDDVATSWSRSDSGSECRRESEELKDVRPRVSRRKPGDSERRARALAKIQPSGGVTATPSAPVEAELEARRKAQNKARGLSERAALMLQRIKPTSPISSSTPSPAARSELVLREGWQRQLQETGTSAVAIPLPNLASWPGSAAARSSMFAVRSQRLSNTVFYGFALAVASAGLLIAVIRSTGVWMAGCVFLAIAGHAAASYTLQNQATLLRQVISRRDRSLAFVVYLIRWLSRR